MTRKSESLITEALGFADDSHASGIEMDNFTQSAAQVATAYALIAIAQELKKFNDEADLELARQERLADIVRS